eukprot:CAMPEP_0169137820 /NCGR_PEP_ID=MMETSP1015-20121227/41782_1 /TAXON_ID=342587 /ORGANISM="Karlodinium micrum, Strain CCMP2283" /LENGTH=347 /DNA_ID=CAMNT_0009202769 /DNA_START=1 /DNA_END=1044 /DNA_ORIENTATION=-
MYKHEDVACWYVVFVIALRAFDAIPIAFMVVRLVFALTQKTRSVLLLALIWSGLGWCSTLNAASTLIKAITGFAVGQFGVAVPSFFMSFSAFGFGLLHFAPEFRFRLQSWFMSRGEAIGTAAGIAELLGGRSIQHVMAAACDNFSCIRADLITKDDMVNNIPRLSALTEKARIGFVDAFFSHSWHDDAEAKWQALQAYRHEFKIANGREPKLWIDKYCIDQSAIDESLACLPLYLSGCEKLLIACGNTYLQRLWCLIEIFVFLEMGGHYADLDVRLLRHFGTGANSECGRSSVTSLGGILEQFDPREAICFTSYDTERLHAVITTTGYDRINRVVDEVFLKQIKSGP